MIFIRAILLKRGITNTLAFGLCFVTQAGVQLCDHWLIATSTSWVQVILLPQPPEYLGLQVRTTTHS